MGEAVDRGLGVLDRVRADGLAATPETYLHLFSLLAAAAAAGHPGLSRGPGPAGR